MLTTFLPKQASDIRPHQLRDNPNTWRMLLLMGLLKPLTPKILTTTTTAIYLPVHERVSCSWGTQIQYCPPPPRSPKPTDVCKTAMYLPVHERRSCHRGAICLSSPADGLIVFVVLRTSLTENNNNNKKILPSLRSDLSPLHLSLRMLSAGAWANEN